MKINTHLKLFSLSIYIAANGMFIFSSCNSSSQNNNATVDTLKIKTDSAVTTPHNQISSKVFLIDSTNKSKGYGYDILINNAPYIHQTNIPAVQGNHSFSSETDAAKVALLMIRKIEMNTMPPSIKPEELDSLGIKINAR